MTRIGAQPSRWLAARWWPASVGLALSCGCAVGAPPPPPAQSATAPSPQVRPAGVEAADLLPAEIVTVGWDRLADAPVVLLRELGSGKVVPIWVGVAEARAVAVALHGIAMPRPMTHDLMRNLLVELGATLVEVRVHELRGDTYIGQLALAVNGRDEPLLVDSRPSDALALALRTEAAIKVSRQVVDSAPAHELVTPGVDEQVVHVAGMTVSAVGEELRRRHELPDRPGLLVIAASGEAALRGVRAGDLVVALDGIPPLSPMALLDAVRRAPSGARLRLTIWRDGEERDVDLPLGDPRSRATRQA